MAGKYFYFVWVLGGKYYRRYKETVLFLIEEV